MSLDGLLAQEQLGGDLAIRPAVADEVGDLALATGERAKPTSSRLDRARRSAVDGCAKRSELALALVTQASGSAGSRPLVSGGQGSDGVVGPAARGDATSTRELAEKARADPVERASFDPFFPSFVGGVAVFEGGRRVGAVGVSGLAGEADEQLALEAIERRRRKLPSRLPQVMLI